MREKLILAIGLCLGLAGCGQEPLRYQSQTQVSTITKRCGEMRECAAYCSRAWGGGSCGQGVDMSGSCLDLVVGYRACMDEMVPKDDWM
jgi:hypothetical protein